MLRRLQSCCHVIPSAVNPVFAVQTWHPCRLISARQAERLRRQAAAKNTKSPASAAAPNAPRLDKSSSRPHPSRTHATNSSHKSAGGSSSGSAAKQPQAAASASSGADRASKAKVRGRFNRLVIERGFFATVYLYVLGESITLTIAYLLHTHRLGVGDVGSWLDWLHFPTDRFLNVGPTIYGLQLSPRLFLNYLVANVCTYPLLPLQMRFCFATAPYLEAPFLMVGKVFKRAEPVIPKAPSAAP